MVATPVMLRTASSSEPSGEVAAVSGLACPQRPTDLNPVSSASEVMMKHLGMGSFVVGERGGDSRPALGASA